MNKETKRSKKYKDRVFLIATALVTVVTLFIFANALWDSYKFRDWVCSVTDRNHCYDLKVIHHLPDSGDRKRLENERRNKKQKEIEHKHGVNF